MLDPADRVYWGVLIVRCQVADPSALEELVRHCQPQLRAFLQKMLPVGARQQADDLAQEVWLDVFRGLARLDDPGAFVPWLYRVARNRAYRMMRGRRADPIGTTELLESADVAEAESGQFTPEDAQAVHAALDRLSPQHREVLLLRFMEELSYDDIAAVVGCPVGTVRSRVYLAKRELRKILERQAIHDSG